MSQLGHDPHGCDLSMPKLGHDPHGCDLSMSQLGHDPHGCDLSMSKLRHDSQPVYKTGNDYSLAGNSTKSPFQLIYLRFICYYKLIGVLTVPLSLSMVRTIMLCITAQLK